jgi:pimeloyl-ACP methyl ester carboxylesterase
VRWPERFVDELDIAPAVLVGNCIGSLMTLHYAAKHPRSVAALVLMNTLDGSVAAAGPMGRGAGLLKLGPLRPLLEWAVAHTPASLALRHPYPHSQFGDLPQSPG